MAIDTRGPWWKGEDFADLSEYLRRLTADAYPVDEVRESACRSCDGRVFGLRALQVEGSAERTCRACGAGEYIADSADAWDEDADDVVVCTCPCGGTDHNVAVGYSLRKGGDEVKWITVGERCVQCGILGSVVDWKIDYGPSLHLLDQA